MFDFIPANEYTFYYYQFFLIVVVFVFINSFFYGIEDKRNTGILNLIGVISLLFSIFYMGLRPVDSVFIDMVFYDYMFERFQQNDPIIYKDDYGFYYFLEYSAKFISSEMFFFICAFLYIFPLYLLSKKLFNQYWFYAFLMLVVSFSFWAYGTNGIRNGLASTFFLLALVFYEKKWLCLLLMLFSCTFHQTLILPTLIFFILYYYQSTRLFLIIWLVSIPISFIIGSFFINYVESLQIGIEKIGSYFTEDVNEEFVNMGFRWDFIIYSATAVFSGWYFIFKKGFKDSLYEHLYSVFLLTNTVWIFIIRVNFSNRFAYLSWFMMAIVIIYPLLKVYLFKHQNLKIGFIVFLYFSFTYLMNVILIK